MWSAIATVAVTVARFFLFGWLTAWLHKRAGKKEGQMEAKIEVARQKEKQHEKLANDAVGIADADDFADRVRDSGF